MQGMSERQYAAHVGLSRGAIQKAKAAERLFSIRTAASTRPPATPGVPRRPIRRRPGNHPHRS